jgi:hypothetical protein
MITHTKMTHIVVQPAFIPKGLKVNPDHPSGYMHPFYLYNARSARLFVIFSASTKSGDPSGVE